MASKDKPPGSLDVRRNIDVGTIPPVWLWSGEEEYLKDELFKQIAVRTVGEGMEAMNVSRFRGGEDAIDVILTTCRTLPMLSSHRAVLVKEIEKLSRAGQEELLAYAADPSPETSLVLAGKGDYRSAFHKHLIQAGAAPAMFWTPFESQTRQWIQIRFRDRGKQCDSEVALALLEQCGGGHGEKVSLQYVAPEIEKIALVMGERDTVSEKDLGVVGRKADEELRKEVVQRVTQRDIAGALRSLDGALLFRGNSEIRLVAMLTHRIINLARAKDWLAAGNRERPGGIWPGEWSEVEPALGRFDSAGLRRSLDALALADRILKSSPKNPRVVLEETIINICT
jgi:DNA polymerase-3 subunit delta